MLNANIYKKNDLTIKTAPTKAFRQGIELAWKPNAITTTQACARQNKIIFHWLLGNTWKTQLLGYCDTLLQENGLNTGVTYLDWKWSSSWVTGVQTRTVVGDTQVTVAGDRVKWRWLPHRLSKRPLPTTALVRTPVTQMIIFSQGKQHSYLYKTLICQFPS